MTIQRDHPQLMDESMNNAKQAHLDLHKMLSDRGINSSHPNLGAFERTSLIAAVCSGPALFLGLAAGCIAGIAALLDRTLLCDDYNAIKLTAVIFLLWSFVAMILTSMTYRKFSR